MIIHAFDAASEVTQALKEKPVDRDEGIFGHEDDSPNYPLNPPRRQPNYPLEPPPTETFKVLEAQRLLEQRYKEELHRRREAEAQAAEWRRKAQAAQQAKTPPDDPYRVLGVTKEAPDFVVKAAYKAAAKRVHEDKGGSQAAMSRLNQAMEIIRRRRGWTK